MSDYRGTIKHAVQVSCKSQIHTSCARNRTGNPRSPQPTPGTLAENDGRPGFPATGHHQRPRVRLSLRKAAWNSPTPTRSTGNPRKPNDRF
jgi:hypothetical protein